MIRAKVAKTKSSREEHRRNTCQWNILVILKCTCMHL